MAPRVLSLHPIVKITALASYSINPFLFTATTFLSLVKSITVVSHIYSIFLSITSSLQCFDLIYTMTGGGPNNASTTLVIYAYSLCFAGSSSAGYAMAVSNILFVVILVIAMLQRGMMKREASEI